MCKSKTEMNRDTTRYTWAIYTPERTPLPAVLLRPDRRGWAKARLPRENLGVGRGGGG